MTRVGHVLFIMLQLGTMLILVLAANTSFADFPRLASFHAGDHFCRGSSHVTATGWSSRTGSSCSRFSPGCSSSCSGERHARSPLCDRGLHVVHVLPGGDGQAPPDPTRAGWRTGLVINGLGAFVSAIMTLIIAATKFTRRRRIILIAIP